MDSGNFIEAEELSEHVIKVDNKYWHYYYRVPKMRTGKKDTGKYQFFSENKVALEKIAVTELETGGFSYAKINTDEHKIVKEYVLCLYYVDDSKKFELANKYKNNPNIKYRYWKSDEDTLKGKYSKQFLDKLSPAERKKWTRSKI